MTEIQKAYCAGLFDGEGTCDAQWYRATKNGRKYIRARMRIINTDRRCLDFVKKAFGTGWVGISHHENGERRKCIYNFVASNSTAVRFALEILPYIVIKKEQVGRMFAELKEEKASRKREGRRCQKTTTDFI